VRGSARSGCKSRSGCAPPSRPVRPRRRDHRSLCGWPSDRPTTSLPINQPAELRSASLGARDRLRHWRAQSRSTSHSKTRWTEALPRSRNACRTPSRRGTKDLRTAAEGVAHHKIVEEPLGRLQPRRQPRESHEDDSRRGHRKCKEPLGLARRLRACTCGIGRSESQGGRVRTSPLSQGHTPRPLGVRLILRLCAALRLVRPGRQGSSRIT
jgi:hypothetical protein